MSLNDYIIVKFKLTRNDNSPEYENEPLEVDVRVKVKLVSTLKDFKASNSEMWLLYNDYQKAVKNNMCTKEEDSDAWFWHSNMSIWSSFRFDDKSLRRMSLYLNWEQVTRYQPKTLQFLKDYQNKIDWSVLSKYRIMNETLIRNIATLVDWTLISRYQKLSEQFIREFRDRVDWRLITQYQKLSDDFIREFQNEVDWNWISRRKDLDKDFIHEFQNLINWDYIDYSLLTEEFIGNHLHLIQFQNSDHIFSFDKSIESDMWVFSEPFLRLSKSYKLTKHTKV